MFVDWFVEGVCAIGYYLELSRSIFFIRVVVKLLDWTARRNKLLHRAALYSGTHRFQ